MSQTLMLTFYGQVKAKKNSKQIAINTRTGKPFVRQSDSAKAQELLMVSAFKSDYRLAEIRREYFENAPAYKVEVEIWNEDKRKHDLDNQLATIMDALVKARILRGDDQQVVEEEIVRYKGVDRLDPRAEITITTIRR